MCVSGISDSSLGPGGSQAPGQGTRGHSAPYLSLFFLPLEELLADPVRVRLPLESPQLSLRPPGDTRSEELVLLMVLK